MTRSSIVTSMTRLSTATAAARTLTLVGFDGGVALSFPVPSSRIPTSSIAASTANDSSFTCCDPVTVMTAAKAVDDDDEEAGEIPVAATAGGVGGCSSGERIRVHHPQP